MSGAATERAQGVFEDAAAVWHMADLGDASGHGSTLAPNGDLKDVSGEDVIAFVLQRALRRMPANILYIAGQVGHGCSKMRPDGFGGAWLFITRQRIEFGSTYDAVNLLAKLESHGLSLDIPKQTLRLYQALRKIAENRLSAVHDFMEQFGAENVGRDFEALLADSRFALDEHTAH